MRRPLLLILTALSSGCAGGATQCLRTPASSKVPPRAVQVCQKALEQHPGRQDVFHRYVELLRLRGDYQTIVRQSRWVLEKDPSRADARFYLAYGLRKRGAYQEALTHYQTYAEAAPQDPDPHFGIALCHEQLGNRQGAIQAYQTYLEKERRVEQQKWVDQANARLASLKNQGPMGSAAMAQSSVNTPSSSGLPQGLGAKPAAISPPASAAKGTQPTGSPSGTLGAGSGSGGAASAGSGAAGAGLAAAGAAGAAGVAAVGGAASSSSQAPADCSSWEKAIAENPFATDAYDGFARCAAQQGRHQEVIKRMRTALRDNPDYDRGWLHLGQALKATGDETQAKVSFSKACAAGVAEACGR